MITSHNNKAVKEIMQLNQRAKARNKQEVFVVEGTKMFAEAPAERIRKVYIAQRAEAELRDMYGEKLSGLDCETVADEVFDRMSDTKTPQGILCLVRQYHYHLEDLLAGRRKSIYISANPVLKQKRLFFILLEDLQDPGNLGTIFRVGEGAGVNGIIMSRQTVDIYNPKTIRSTMGSIYRVPFLYTENIQEAIRTLQKNEIKVYAAYLGDAKYYDECDYYCSTAFLIGNEANGLRAETAACADERIRIPMEGKVESLNAAVASSVLLYEAYRQRRNARRREGSMEVKKV